MCISLVVSAYSQVRQERRRIATNMGGRISNETRGPPSAVPKQHIKNIYTLKNSKACLTHKLSLGRRRGVRTPHADNAEAAMMLLVSTTMSAVRYHDSVVFASASIDGSVSGRRRHNIGIVGSPLASCRLPACARSAYEAADALQP